MIGDGDLMMGVYTTPIGQRAIANDGAQAVQRRATLRIKLYFHSYIKDLQISSKRSIIFLKILAA